MELTGSHTVPGTPDAVWAALHDPEVLRECIPGAESVEQTGEGRYSAVVAVKIGPVKARFNGLAEWLDREAPEGLARSGELKGEGSGGAAGFAKGGAAVFLRDLGDGSVELTYEASATIGGKLAQVGQRLVDSVARSLADQFFTRFAAKMEGASIEG